MRTAYKCRVYPDPEQASVLNRTFGCIRVAWNRTLAWRQARYRDEQASTSYAQASAYLTAMKADQDLGWLNEVSSVPASIDPTTVTVSREPCGRWYVSFAVDVPEPTPLPATGAAVGVDLGIKDFAVTSDGKRIPNPRSLARRERSLARYQRRLARCQQGSANRAKAKAKVARAHRKVRASRADFLHRTSTRLVRDHDVIVIEDLNVSGMVRNHSLAKAISDCGWGEFRRHVEYKAARAGRHLIIINRFYPSSKTCSECGHLLKELSLSTRAWRCPSCGTRHDRDVNAAKNILAAGLAVTACGADVRHPGTSRVRSAVKQEPRPVRARIPVLQGGE